MGLDEELMATDADRAANITAGYMVSEVTDPAFFNAEEGRALRYPILDGLNQGALQSSLRLIEQGAPEADVVLMLVGFRLAIMAIASYASHEVPDAMPPSPDL